MVTRRVAQSRFEGKPVLVLPAMIALRADPQDKPVSEGGGAEGVAILVGYLFDGHDWRPALAGKPGSDPFENRLAPVTLLPQDPVGYTKSIRMPGHKGAPGHEMPGMAVVAMFQQALDRHHDLGPTYQRKHGVDDMRETYAMRTWDDDWVSFLDLAQDEVYGPPGDSDA